MSFYQSIIRPALLICLPKQLMRSELIFCGMDLLRNFSKKDSPKDSELVNSATSIAGLTFKTLWEWRQGLIKCDRSQSTGFVGVRIC